MGHLYVHSSIRCIVEGPIMKLKAGRVEVFRENDVDFTAERKPAAQKMHKDNIVLHQPVHQRKMKWIIGDVTEVLDRSSWRLGTVMKVLKNNYFAIRLTGCIQLREFHISRLRVPHARHGEQTTAVDKVTEQGKQTRHADCTFPPTKVTVELSHQAHKEEDHVAMASASARHNKREATAYESLRPNKKTQIRKVDTVSAPRDVMAGNCFYRSSDDRCADPTKVDVVKRDPKGQVVRSSVAPFQVRKEDECSVASCSVNDLKYSTSDNNRSTGVGIPFPDDAMSACPSTSRRENSNVFSKELATDIHELELQAYQSTVRAFHASGPLTWEQESLLTNLRLSLNISNEEHLLQLRHLLSS